MTVAWVAYCLLISLLLWCAAYLAESAVRLYSWPIRWIWAGALVGSVAFPLTALLVPIPRAIAPELIWTPLLTALEASEGGAARGAAETWRILSGLVALDRLILAGWLIMSAVTVSYYMQSYLRLKRSRKSWLRRAVDGTPVLVSQAVGPAVTGFLRGRIVVPDWALELETHLRDIVLLHEEEHLRAGDQRLHYLALTVIALLPWNVPLWWQVRRLRLAIELDCDRRVLERGASLRTYGQLLLQVARRPAARTLPTAFSEPTSFLQERIEQMVRKTPRHRRAKALAAMLAASGVVALACEAPGPESTEPLDVETYSASEIQPSPSEPEFTPFTVRPEIANRRRAIEVVERFYPPQLEEAGIGGQVVVFVYIDDTGQVHNAVVQKGSGRDELDEAARRAALEFEFTPALNRSKPVAVWVAIPITFSVKSGG